MTKLSLKEGAEKLRQSIEAGKKMSNAEIAAKLLNAELGTEFEARDLAAIENIPDINTPRRHMQNNQTNVLRQRCGRGFIKEAKTEKCMTMNI